jgi:hypothetical protein
MALDAGSEKADAGMSQAIYKKIDELLSPPLAAAVDKVSSDPKAKEAAQKALEEARTGWKKLSFAISTGVIQHVRDNMEIKGVQTRGDVSASASTATGASPPGPHTHTVSVTATQSAVTFTQSNDGKGHVA